MKLKVAILQKGSLDRQFAKSTEIILGRMQEVAEHGGGYTPAARGVSDGIRIADDQRGGPLR